MYISFVGLSGAGKTTICSKVIDNLKKKGYNVESFKPLYGNKKNIFIKIFHGIVLLQYFKIAYIKLIFLNWKSDKIFGNAKLGRVFFILVLKYRLNKLVNKKYNFLVYDEDLINWILYAQKNDISINYLFSIYTDLFTNKDLKILIVHVKNDLKKSITNKLKRDMQIGVEDLDIVDNKKIFDRYKKYDKDLNVFLALAKKNSISILEIDGKKPPEENAKKVAEVALALLRERENNSA